MPRVRALAADIDPTDNSRTKLLRAGERQIMLHGRHSLTIRPIETYAGVNSSLIGYCFGGLNGLLAELLHANLDLILADRAHRLAVLAHTGRGESAEAVLEAFLRSLWREAFYDPKEHALSVVCEIFAVAVGKLRKDVTTKMDVSFRDVADALKRCLLELEETTLFCRLRCISGAMVTPLCGLPGMTAPADDGALSAPRRSRSFVGTGCHRTGCGAAANVSVHLPSGCARHVRVGKRISARRAA